MQNSKKVIVVGVKILPKKETLDVQGRAVANILKRHGYVVDDCRCGKFIRLKIATNNPQDALQKANKMAESILCNLLVEEYELEVL